MIGLMKLTKRPDDLYDGELVDGTKFKGKDHAWLVEKVEAQQAREEEALKAPNKL